MCDGGLGVEEPFEGFGTERLIEIGTGSGTGLGVVVCMAPEQWLLALSWDSFRLEGISVVPLIEYCTILYRGKRHLLGKSILHVSFVTRL